jgi:hypothetical protein
MYCALLAASTSFVFARYTESTNLEPKLQACMSVLGDRDADVAAVFKKEWPADAIAYPCRAYRSHPNQSNGRNWQ